MIVVISGWKVGFRKVRFTTLLRSELQYGLARAKGITNAIMEGHTVELEVSEDLATRLMLQMTQLGAECALAMATA